MESIIEYKCECGKVFNRKESLGGHKSHCILNPNYEQNKQINFEVLSKRNKEKFCCPFCKKEWETQKRSFSFHLNRCKENPNRKQHNWEGVKHSEESKKKISESMKKAHQEGRAYVWEHRMTEPSRPEQFLIDVLKNELNMDCGKDYLREVPYNGFFLDFCWIDKKVVIEMDGGQHQRFQEQIEKDKRKDALLKADGYKELRIPWQECFHNPKDWIAKVRELLK